MKNQKGFTLIELLLVLAIIGIISAIAIPALLGQRSRARDKSSQENCVSVVGDIVSAYDKARENGVDVSTVDTFTANIVGDSAATSQIPVVWTAKNPWNTIGALAAYNAVVVTETDTIGSATKGAATADNKGQVQIGYLPATATAPGVAATAAYLNNTFKDATNTDANVFVKVSNVE
ncbi:prepilin-type N-terminal cleavage/methylation domain-containing protein [Geothrix campi]|uniref:prepilin-type N-terminal cleavage/methylation domain-containing protein n=1 Tax=Geothrix campi TaxID=2966450 RepID=UPI0027D28887|nr:prepilin-type N-terminal cleavage/methylation domain-containing protein [Geothrix sp. SG10]